MSTITCISVSYIIFTKSYLKIQSLTHLPDISLGKYVPINHTKLHQEANTLCTSPIWVLRCPFWEKSLWHIIHSNCFCLPHSCFQCLIMLDLCLYLRPHLLGQWCSANNILWWILKLPSEKPRKNILILIKKFHDKKNEAIDRQEWDLFTLMHKNKMKMETKNTFIATRSIIENYINNLWTITQWVLKLLFWANALPHKLHLNFLLTPHSYLKWNVKCCLCLYLRPQFWHECLIYLAVS